MKRILPCAILIALAMLSSCRPTEEGYRTAYERTMSARAEADSTLAADGFSKEKPRQAVATAQGDTIEVLTQFVAGLDANGKTGNDNFQRYNVVVSRFSQQFNALSMASRLREGGYPEALVLMTSKPEFYVVAESFGTLNEAAELTRRLREDKKTPVVIRAPFPYILESASHRR